MATYGHEGGGAMNADQRGGHTPCPPPAINMVLPCPVCGVRHIDAPEPEKGWSNPPHRSHLCHECGTIWRPADVPTNGVAAVRTRGRHDTFPTLHGEQPREGGG